MLTAASLLELRYDFQKDAGETRDDALAARHYDALVTAAALVQASLTAPPLLPPPCTGGTRGSGRSCFQVMLCYGLYIVHVYPWMHGRGSLHSLYSLEHQLHSSSYEKKKMECG